MSVTKKQDAELLAEIYRNCEMSCESINNVIKKVSDMEMLRELTGIVLKTCDFSEEASKMMHERGITPEEISKMKQKSIAAAITMNTMFDASTSHIAEMTARGLTMGVTELSELKSKLYPCDEKVESLLEQVIEFEKKSAEKMMAYVED